MSAVLAPNRNSSHPAQPFAVPDLPHHQLHLTFHTRPLSLLPLHRHWRLPISCGSYTPTRKLLHSTCHIRCYNRDCSAGAGGCESDPRAVPPVSQSAAPTCRTCLAMNAFCEGTGYCQSAAGAVPQPSDTVGSHHPFPAAGGGYAIGTGMGFARGRGVRMGGRQGGRRGRGREVGDGQWEVRCNPTTAYDRGFLQHYDNLAPLP